DVFALVADALALVGLGRADGADLGGELADDLLAGSLDDDLRGLRHLDRDAGRDGQRARLAEAQREHEVLALDLGVVADALDREPLLVALLHALDHARAERAVQAVQRALAPALGLAREGGAAALLVDGHLDRGVDDLAE